MKNAAKMLLAIWCLNTALGLEKIVNLLLKAAKKLGGINQNALQ